MSYKWVEMWSVAQMGCDLVVCHNEAYGFAKVDLKDQSLGGFRQRLYLALCLEHLPIGEPVSRGEWVRDDVSLWFPALYNKNTAHVEKVGSASFDKFEAKRRTAEMLDDHKKECNAKDCPITPVILYKEP